MDDGTDRRFEIAAHAASLGVWDWDLTTNRFHYSDRAKEICGFAADRQVSLEDVRGVTHPDDYPWTSAQAALAVDPQVKSAEPYRYRVIRADTNECRWVVAHGEAVFETHDGSEQAVRYIGTLQDITAQHDAEQALVESEARLRLAVEAGRAAVWEIDLDRQVVTPSPELNALFGFAPDAEPSIEEFQALYADGEVRRLQEEGAAAQERGESQIQTSLHIVWADGSNRWLLLRARLAPPTEKIEHRVIGVLIDITAQKAAEERAELVAGEMQHRVKNLLTVVQSLASQSFRKHENEASQAFIARLNALARVTQNVLGGEGKSTLMRQLVEQAIEPYLTDENSIYVGGPQVALSSEAATALALGLHELCTNAVKHGSLSVPDGEVSLTWHIQDEGLHVLWVETGGPPVVEPAHTGFGTRVLTRGLGNGASLRFDPRGLRATFKLAPEAWRSIAGQDQLSIEAGAEFADS